MMIWIASVGSERRILSGARHGHGPVDDVWVDVVQLEILQSRIEVQRDVLGAVVGVPQLRLDEQFLPKNKVFFVGWIAFGCKMGNQNMVDEKLNTFCKLFWNLKTKTFPSGLPTSVSLDGCNYKKKVIFVECLYFSNNVNKVMLN